MPRRSHRKKRVANEIRQLPWRNIVNPYALIDYVVKRKQTLMAEIQEIPEQQVCDQH